MKRRNTKLTGMGIAAVALLATAAIDERPPQVEQVGFASLPPGGSWEAGDLLEVDVEFSEHVTVTPPGPGTPELPSLRLQIGGEIGLATWDPASSESPRLRFVYRIEETDLDADGISIEADALQANGWTIADLVGNPALLDLGRQAIAPHPDHTVVATAVPASVPALTHVVRSPAPVVYPAAPLSRAPAPRSSVPTVTAVRVVTGEPLQYTFGRGETVWISVAFNEAVVVNGLPTLDLVVGDRRKRAVYHDSGSPTQEVWFKYDVKPEDRDLDGIEVLADGLRPDAAGGIRRADGTAVDLAFGPSVVRAQRHAVDGSLAQPVRVDRVAFLSQPAFGDTYRAGEEVRVLVVFRAPVAVSSARPTLTLTVGRHQRVASWLLSAAEARSWVFHYTIASNDADADGVSIAPTALHIPAGGSVVGVAGTAVDLSLGRHAVASGHRVDGQRPVVDSVVIDSDAGRSWVFKPGMHFRVTVGFNEDIAVHLRSPSRRDGGLRLPRLRLQVGERARHADLDVFRVGSSTLAFEYEFQSDDLDMDGITVAADALDGGDYAITDVAGNPADLTLGRHAVTDDPAHAVDNVAVTDLVLSDAQVVLSASDDDAFDRPIVADEVLVNGAITTRKPVAIVANHLDFGRHGSIEAPAITVIANRVSGGRLDASGSDARRRGRSGTQAGSIFVAAARLERTLLDASGGNGAPGRRGRRGRNGVDGRCTSFFGISKWFGGRRWRNATAGENGGDGGRGGNGGDGGTITLMTLPDSGATAAQSRHRGQHQPVRLFTQRSVGQQALRADRGHCRGRRARAVLVRRQPAAVVGRGTSSVPGRRRGVPTGRSGRNPGDGDRAAPRRRRCGGKSRGRVARKGRDRPARALQARGRSGGCWAGRPPESSVERSGRTAPQCAEAPWLRAGTQAPGRRQESGEVLLPADYRVNCRFGEGMGGVSWRAAVPPVPAHLTTSSAAGQAPAVSAGMSGTGWHSGTHDPRVPTPAGRTSTRRQGNGTPEIASLARNSEPRQK